MKNWGYLKMSKYSIWKNENEPYRILVQVFNRCDLADVQKEFIEKGYVIEELAHIGNDICFVACERKLYE